MKTKIRVQEIAFLLILMAFVGAGGFYLKTQGVVHNNINPTHVDVNSELQKNVEPIDTTQGVPVLMYRQIEPDKDIFPSPNAKYASNMAVTPEEFKEHMSYFKNQGYNTISYDKLYDYMTNGSSLPPKPIVISFDGGYHSNYIHAYSILKDIGMTAEIAVVTGVNTRDNVSDLKTLSKHFGWKHAREMYDSGNINLVSHTVTHKILTKATQEEIINEIKNSKESIEKQFDITVSTLVYPDGEYNEQVISLAKEQGYKMGVTVDEGFNYYKDDTMKVKRFIIHHKEDGQSIEQRILNYIKK